MRRFTQNYKALCTKSETLHLARFGWLTEVEQAIVLAKIYQGTSKTLVFQIMSRNVRSGSISGKRMSISGAQPGYPSAQPNQYTVAEMDTDVPYATAIVHVDEVNGKNRIMEAKMQGSSDNLAGQSQGIKHWPSGLREKLIQTFKKPPNERRGGEYLARYEWPEGLKSTIFKSCKKIPLRFFIIDDSG